VLDGNDDLDAVVNPTQLSLGDQPTRQYFGALIADFSIICGMMFVQLVIGVVMYTCRRQHTTPPAHNPREPLASDDETAETAEPVETAEPADDVSAESGVVSDRTFHMSLLAAKLPRANYIWFMLFLQPITQCALMLVSQSPDKPGHYVIGAIAFIIAQVVSLGLTLQLTGKRLRAVYIARPWAVSPEGSASGGGTGGDRRRGYRGDRPTFRRPTVLLVSSYLEVTGMLGLAGYQGEASSQHVQAALCAVPFRRSFVLVRRRGDGNIVRRGRGDVAKHIARVRHPTQRHLRSHDDLPRRRPRGASLRCAHG
jgi:hypothetical protein